MWCRDDVSLNLVPLALAMPQLIVGNWCLCPFAVVQVEHEIAAGHLLIWGNFLKRRMNGFLGNVIFGDGMDGFGENL